MHVVYKPSLLLVLMIWQGLFYTLYMIPRIRKYSFPPPKFPSQKQSIN